MKKTLALVLSVAMVLALAAGMFSFSASADTAPAVATKSVAITKTDDTVVYLGYQPVYDTADPTKIVSYTETGAKASETIGSGTASFADGVLTINNIEVKKIAAPIGSLTVVVKGTNVINNGSKDNGLFVNAKTEADLTVAAVADLTIKGDGTVTVTGQNYVVGTQNGNLNVEESVKLNVVCAQDGIHIANSSICSPVATFAGSSVTTVTQQEGKTATKQLVRLGDADGKFVMKDNAVLDCKAERLDGWAYVVKVGNIVMDGGTLNIYGRQPTLAPAQSVVALGTDAIADSYADFNGGTVKIDLDAIHENSRGYGVFFKNWDYVKFNGTNFDIKLNNVKWNNPNNGVFCIQGTLKDGIYFNDGEFNIDAPNTNAVINCQLAGKLAISGGVIKSTGTNYFAYDSAGTTLDITGGAFDITAATAIIGETATKVTNSVKMKKGAFDNKETVALTDMPSESAKLAAPIEKAVASSTKATSVQVLLNDGTVKYLGYQPAADIKVAGFNGATELSTTKVDSMTAGKGTLSFDVATGTLTMNKATDIYRIQARNGSMIVKLVGDNELSSYGTAGIAKKFTAYQGADEESVNVNNSLWVNYGANTAMDVGSLTVCGDGTLTMTAGQYALGSQTGNVIIKESAKIIFDQKVGDCILISNTQYGGKMLIEDNAKVTIKGGKADTNLNGIRNQGWDSALIIKDNAVVDTSATVSGGSVLLNNADTSKLIVTDNAVLTVGALNLPSTDGIQLTGNGKNIDDINGNSVYFEVSGKAKVTVTASSCGVRLNATSAAADATATFIAKDEAVVDVKGKGQTFYLLSPNGSAEGSSSFTVQDSAKVTVENNGPVANGTYYAVLQLNGNSSTVKGKLAVLGGSLTLKCAAENTIGLLRADAGFDGVVTNDGKQTKGSIAAYDAAASKAGATGTYQCYYKTSDTADASFAIVSVVALISMIAAAAVVLRKKVNG